MKRLLCIVFTIAFTFVFSNCAKDSAEDATATTLQPEKARPAEARKATAPKMASSASAPAKAPRASIPTTIRVPEGTELSVLLIDSVSTKKSKAGDQFLASLAEPIAVDGRKIVDRGTKVQGRVVDAEGSGRVKGRANIHLVLTSILDGAKTYPIVTRPFVAEAESTKGRDAGIIGGVAGVGAAIGAIAGGKSGAVKGAVIGGAAGTGTVLATKGKEVEFDSETKLKFTLEKGTELPRITSRIS